MRTLYRPTMVASIQQEEFRRLKEAAGLGFVEIAEQPDGRFYFGRQAFTIEQIAQIGATFPRVAAEYRLFYLRWKQIPASERCEGSGSGFTTENGRGDNVMYLDAE